MVLAPVLTAVLPALIGLALSDAGLLARAEASFAAGLGVRGQPSRARPLFRTAAEAYRKLHDRGLRNADLLRNEGNAWLLADDLPRAILAYRRGLRLDPADRSLQECLTFAREQVFYPFQGSFGRPPTNNRPPWLPRLGLSAWSFGFLLALYALCWGFLARWLMTRRSRLLLLAVSGLALLIVVAGLFVVGTCYENRAAQGSVAVIARDGVYLRKGNSMAFPPRDETPLNRGVEARLLFRRGDWVQIELSAGQVGWIPAAAVVADEPGTPNPNGQASGGRQLPENVADSGG